MLKMDSHIHSEYSPDSNSKIDDILKVAKSKNIDVIAISDHNTVDGTSEVLKKTRNTDILAIPSIEISSTQGHILGLAIIPHPFCFYRHGLLHKSDYKDLKIDAIETKNARFILGYCNNKAKNLSKKENLPELGASDAHYYKFVGDCFSMVDAEKDIDSIMKAIKKSKIKAHGKGTSNILLSKYLFEKNILKKFD